MTAPATEPQQYDAVAADYDRLIRPKYDAIAALVVDRVRELTDVRRADVVELSAGTGALTHQLAPLAGSYVATDISEQMLGVAIGRDVPGSDRVRWLRADVRDVGLDAACADLVVSSLGPVQDSTVALGEARRVLRPGGLFVGVTWGDDYRELHLLDAARARLGLPPRTTTSATELTDRLRGAGLRAVTVRDVRLPVVHNSVESYLAYRQAFGPVPDLVTDDPAELGRAIAECARPYTEADGRVMLDWHLLVMSGRR